ncbi:MAG: DNA-directed RNA polymerase subunit E'' [Candidatus Thermoplasmatota archaeon]|jgi:DNA-directed RNA polymerase subunit E"|nr:DNA-directed RNA polymerase subunit E'' [Candidatus Thermoplasmatota archaeon]MCL5785087.1 DNA-directed RNA polymerase subunit E'' [Candidatus Thermoplasmatota archaeon]
MKTVYRACKKCKSLTDAKNCPHHPEERTTTEWFGFVFVESPEESVIAQESGLKSKGRYAIKVR